MFSPRISCRAANYTFTNRVISNQPHVGCGAFTTNNAKFLPQQRAGVAWREIVGVDANTPFPTICPASPYPATYPSTFPAELTDTFSVVEQELRI